MTGNMNYFRETTDWNTPNHVYLLDDNKQYMHGYMVDGREPLQKFKAPIRFDTRGRTFVFHSAYAAKPIERNIVSVTVAGSKGDLYTVILEDSTSSCNCTGFKYRGECKHQALARETLIYV